MPASSTRSRKLPPHGLTALAALLAPAMPCWAQAGDAPAAGIQEVIVTAQKRQQSELKTPISLSAVTGDDLRASGVVSAKGLTDLMAGVQIGGGFANSTDINIRGLGTTDVSERGDPAAAFHIDGVYFGRPQGAGAAFLDVDRVEVLRGPQGTLYGRNATAGAVNIITNRPKPKLQGSVDLTVGNYGLLQAEGMVNVPINETIGLRAAVSAQKRDGFSDTAHAPQNSYGADRDDADLITARVQAQAKLGAGSTLWMSVDGTQDRNHNSATYLIPAPFTQGVSQRKINPRVEGKRDNKSEGAAFEFKTGFGAVDLTYLYGHRAATRDEIDSLGDVSGPVGNQFATFSNSVKSDSHELRLSNADGAAALQWVAGLFAFKEKNRNVDFQINNLTGFPGSFLRFQQDPTIADSQAVFGQGTYSLSPVLRVTAGARYTHDQKSRVGVQTLHPSPAFIVTNNNASGTWNKTTWKLGVDYDISKTALVYANVATGYKAGGYNDGNAATNADLYYNPENVTSYEFGVKGRFLDNQLRLSAGLFSYDYSDLQVSSVVNNLLKTFNAAKARVNGAEFEGKWQVGAQGRLNFALSLLDAKYTRLMLSSGNGANNSDFSGKKLDKAPSSTLSLGYNHAWDLASGASISANVNHRYSAKYVFLDPGTATVAAHQIEQKGFGKTDLTLTYSAPDDRWSVQAWARNIEDRTVITGMFNNVGANYAFLGEPRTYGLRFATRF